MSSGISFNWSQFEQALQARFVWYVLHLTLDLSAVTTAGILQRPFGCWQTMGCWPGVPNHPNKWPDPHCFPCPGHARIALSIFQISVLLIPCNGKNAHFTLLLAVNEHVRSHKRITEGTGDSATINESGLITGEFHARLWGWHQGASCFFLQLLKDVESCCRNNCKLKLNIFPSSDNGNCLSGSETLG